MTVPHTVDVAAFRRERRDYVALDDVTWPSELAGNEIRFPSGVYLRQTRFDYFPFCRVSFFQRPTSFDGGRAPPRGSIGQGKINEAANQRGTLRSHTLPAFLLLLFLFSNPRRPPLSFPTPPLFERFVEYRRVADLFFSLFVADVPSEQSVFVMLNGEESELRFLNIANAKVSLGKMMFGDDRFHQG